MAGLLSRLFDMRAHLAKARTAKDRNLVVPELGPFPEGYAETLGATLAAFPQGREAVPQWELGAHGIEDNLTVRRLADAGVSLTGRAAGITSGRDNYFVADVQDLAETVNRQAFTHLLGATPEVRSAAVVARVYDLMGPSEEDRVAFCKLVAFEHTKRLERDRKLNAF